MWFKPCIDMDNKLRGKVNNDFKKGFFKLMNNSVLEKAIRQWKTLESRVRLVTTDNAF